MYRRHIVLTPSKLALSKLQHQKPPTTFPSTFYRIMLFASYDEIQFHFSFFFFNLFFLFYLLPLAFFIFFLSFFIVLRLFSPFFVLFRLFSSFFAFLRLSSAFFDLLRLSSSFFAFLRFSSFFFALLRLSSSSPSLFSSFLVFLRLTPEKFHLFLSRDVISLSLYLTTLFKTFSAGSWIPKCSAGLFHARGYKVLMSRRH